MLNHILERFAPSIMTAMMAALIFTMMLFISERINHGTTLEEKIVAEHIALLERTNAEKVIELNAGLNDTIIELGESKIRQEHVAIAAIEREREASFQRDVARKELLNFKEQPDVKAYFSIRTPQPVYNWLYNLSSSKNRGGDSNGNPNSQGIPSRDSNSPDTETEFTTTEENLMWCKQLNEAFNQCNADKAAIAAWGKGK